MLPRITMSVVVVAIIFYLVGAKWPALASRVGIA